MSVEKTPKRAAAGFDPSLAQFCSRFYQGQVRLLGNQIQNLGRELFQRRNASAARLRRGASLLAPALQPLYCRGHGAKSEETAKHSEPLAVKAKDGPLTQADVDAYAASYVFGEHTARRRTNDPVEAEALELKQFPADLNRWDSQQSRNE